MKKQASYKFTIILRLSFIILDNNYLNNLV